MSIEQAFLADIREHPEDDAPRLVLADWLEENAAAGDPRAERAELIRLQIDLERETPGLGSCLLTPEGNTRLGRWGPAPIIQVRQARMQELVRRLFDVKSWGCRSCRIERGFPAALHASLQSLARESPAWEMHPIREWQVFKARLRGARLAGLPSLARLASLRVGEVASADLRALGQSPHLGGLGKLGLHAPSTDDVLALMTSPTLGRVTTLQLGGEDQGAHTRTEPFGDGLWLHVRVDPTRDDSDLLLRLAGLPALHRVRRLSIVDRQVPAAGMRALAQSPYLQGIEHLTLSFCRFDLATLDALGEAPWVGQLRSLALHHPVVTRGVLTTLGGWIARLGYLWERLASGRSERFELRGVQLSTATHERLRQRLGERLVVIDT
jgi:uncharacterized protein (TIGR02996 family)